MKSACVGILSTIELKNARWNIEIIYCEVYKNIILSTLATEQPLGFEIYNVTLSTVGGFRLGTSTFWRWYIHAKTCHSNSILLYVYDVVYLLSCGKQIQWSKMHGLNNS